MKILKLIRLLLYSVSFILLSLMVDILFRNKNTRLKVKACLNHDLAMSIRRLLNISVRLEGCVLEKDEIGNFIISNHLSYIDGIILGSIFKVIYISKKQVRSWPFFGIVANLGGTIFIDREKKLLSLEYTNNIKEILEKGINILLFPEGTSTNGKGILPFQSLFFSSPIQAKANIIPVTISYSCINNKVIQEQDKDKIHWYGQVSFHQHLWQALSIKNIGVTIAIHPKIKAVEYENNSQSRRDLAFATREIISSGAF